MRALIVTHCILLALATGIMLASGASPAPAIGGTSTNAGCPATTTTGQGRSSGFVGYRLDDTIQSGSSCAWTISTASTHNLVLVVKRVEDFSANTKITAAMFNTTMLVGNSTQNNHRRQATGNQEDDDSEDEDGDGISNSTSNSQSHSKASNASTTSADGSKHSSSNSSSKSRKESDVPTASNDDDDDDASSKNASNSKTSGDSKHSSKSASKSSKKSNDDDDEDESSKKASSKSNSKSSKKGDADSSQYSVSKESDSPPTSTPVTSVPSTTATPPTQVPQTALPATLAPTTAAPSTNAPATATPSTVAPSTAAPATATPTTAVPATSAPETAVPATTNNGQPAQKDSTVLGTVPTRFPTGAKLVISTNSAIPASSSASNVVVGIRYTYAEAASLRATLRDVTLSGSQGTLVIGSSSTKRQSTQVTFADAKDSSLVLSCANGDYDVRINSVSGTAADPADSVTFIGDMSQSSLTCTYTAPSSSGSSSTWTAVHGYEPCVGAQFIVNYNTTSKSSSTASIKVDYTCEPEAVAEAQAVKTQSDAKRGTSETAIVAGAVIGVSVLLFIAVALVLCCCLKGRRQDKKRCHPAGQGEAKSPRDPIGVLSRRTSAMSEDTVVVMAAWDAANQQHDVSANKYHQGTTKGDDLEIDDGFHVTICGNEPLGLSPAPSVADYAEKKLKLVEDEVVVDGERVSVRRSAPREGFSVLQDPPAQDDEGEEYMRRKSLTRSSVGSCGSYGTADGLSPRPELTLNNDE